MWRKRWSFLFILLVSFPLQLWKQGCFMDPYQNLALLTLLSMLWGLFLLYLLYRCWLTFRKK